MRTWIIAGLIATTVPAAACGGMTDNNSTQNSQANSENAEATQTVRGMLTADASGEGNVEGKTITASRVADDGQVEAIADASAKTDAEGHYTLKLDDELEQGTTVLVEAMQDEDVLGSASFDVRAETEDRGIDAPPITVESTTESRVFIQARAQATTCAGCSEADVEQRIDERLAAVIETAAESDSDIHANLAASMYAGIDAFDSMLTDESVGVADSELTAAQQASTGAYLELQSSLADADNQADIDTAHDTFTEAYLTAYQDAGITAEQLAAGTHAEAAVRSAAEVSSDAQTNANLLSQIELRRADRVTAAIESDFEARGESNTEVATAGDELIASIEGASDAGTEARAQVGEAWAQYESTVRSEIEAELDVAQQTALAGLQTAFDTATETYVSALAQSASDVGATVDALASLRGEVSSQSNLEALTTAGLDEAAAQSYLKVIFHLEAASAVGAGT